MTEPYVPPPAPAPDPVEPRPMPAYGAYASPDAYAPPGGYPPPGTYPAPYVAHAPGAWGPQGWRPTLPPAPLGLGTATIVLAGVWTALQVLSLATSFGAADQLAAADAAGTPAPFAAYDGVTFLMFPVQIAAYVVSCLWLQSSRTLTEVVAPMVPQTRGRVWVWLGWVVPVVSLWFPYQVVRDVAGATGARLRVTLGWWWACWLAALSFTNQASFAAAGLGSRDPSMIPAFEALAASALVAAFVLWVRIVRAVMVWQRAYAARVG